MLIRKPSDIPSSEITSPEEYARFLNRRRFLRAAVGAGAVALGAERLSGVFSPNIDVSADSKLQTVKSPLTTAGEQLTSLQDITHYNNYYEFGVPKNEPSENAGVLPTRP